MTVETKQHLSPQTISALQDLIQANIDSRDGFRYAAQSVDNLTLQSAFEEVADHRDGQADELAQYVAWNGEQPRRDGSVAAAVHRTWMSVRELLSSDDLHAVLAEAERGEDAIRRAYENALQSTAGSAMNDVVLHQYVAVKATHDRIRELRDECRCG
jgi:uncharacterized protein (TIGR02284 family)